MPFPLTNILTRFPDADLTSPPAGFTNCTDVGIVGILVFSFQCGSAGASFGAGDWSTSFGAPQEAYCDISTITAAVNFYLPLRQAAATTIDNGYLVQFLSAVGNDVVRVFEQTSGVATQLGGDIDYGGEYAVGQQVGARIVNSTIGAYKNGVLLGERTDGSSVHPNAGFIGLLFADNTMLVDNFGGGVLVPRAQAQVIG